MSCRNAWWRTQSLSNLSQSPISLLTGKDTGKFRKYSPSLRKTRAHKVPQISVRRAFSLTTRTGNAWPKNSELFRVNNECDPSDYVRFTPERRRRSARS
jgi:hypothetical protein